MSDRIGTQSTAINSEEVEHNKQTGNKTTYTYEGSKSDMVAQRMVEIGRGAAYVKITSRGDGFYQLIATYNYDLASGEGSEGETPASVHDIEVSMETTSVYTSPKLYSSLLAAFGGVHDSVNKAISAVKVAVHLFHNPAAYDVVADSPRALIDAKASIAKVFPANAEAQAIMLSLFYLILRGAETTVEYNSVYRRSITAATPLQVQASRTGEGLIWTSSEVSSFENLPAFWWFSLPSDQQWLKVPCNVNMIAGGKTRVDYHYIGFKQASSLLYTAYNSAVLLP